ncbi:MAG: methionine ABC transporter ATP-binding protein [Succinivibrio sp.]
MITLKNISKTFNRDGKIVKAVKNVSLDIKDGEIFGVIGFSGAGKSTLVRCINLLEVPDAGGNVIFEGQDLTLISKKELRKVREKISMIFQHFNLMPSRTILENVYFPLVGKGLPKEKMKQRALELLDKVGLKARANAYPSELSGGQKQRVAIARALSSDPKVLLCDEATSALDPTTTREIVELLKKLNRELNLTIVVITHEMAVVKDLCSRVAVMESGEVVEVGDTFNVFANSENETTRKFVNVTSKLSLAEKILEEKRELLNLNEGDSYVRFTFTGKGVSEPLLSTLSEKFSVRVNIILADVEFVNDAPIGGTVAVLIGQKKNIEDALLWMKEKQIKVEVLANG